MIRPAGRCYGFSLLSVVSLEICDIFRCCHARESEGIVHQAGNSVIFVGKVVTVSDVSGAVPCRITELGVDCVPFKSTEVDGDTDFVVVSVDGEDDVDPVVGVGICEFMVVSVSVAVTDVESYV